MATKTKRKPIPKNVRFEVFKRDSFTCQYCGAQAPEVILEIDHITPVAKGGDNTILNLITSCRDCNRGKRDRELNDDSAVARQKKQLDELQQRKELMEMMIAWKEELMEIEERETDLISALIEGMTNYCLGPDGRTVIKRLLKRFSFSEVCTATEISFEKYYNGSDYGFRNALYKIGGVCYNRKKKREQDAE